MVVKQCQTFGENLPVFKLTIILLCVDLRRQLVEQVTSDADRGTEDSVERSEGLYVTSLVPLLLDATTESQSDFAALALQDLPGGYENEMHSQVMLI